MHEEIQKINEQLTLLLADEMLPRQVCPEYLMEAVLAYPLRGGKRLRPALACWFCGLVGGDPDAALRTALAIELYHNWTLIHDDIIDDDDLRRGAPSCHILLAAAGRKIGSQEQGFAACFGRNMAILAGDILHGWSVNLLARAGEDGVPAEVVNMLVRRLSGWVTPELISGEALDVEFESRGQLSIDEIENMLLMKTGVLLQFAAEAGVMIGRQTSDIGHPEVRRAADFAAHAGMAFQLQDDILGMFGDQQRLGKPVCSDLREGKKTLLLVHTLERCSTAERQELQAMVARSDLTDRDTVRAQEIMTSCGALAAVQQRANELAEQARECLDAFPENRFRNLLHQWVDFLVQRHH